MSNLPPLPPGFELDQPQQQQQQQQQALPPLPPGFELDAPAPAPQAAAAPQPQGFVGRTMDYLFPGTASPESAMGQFRASAGQAKQVAEAARTGQPLPWNADAIARDPIMMSIGPSNLAGRSAAIVKPPAAPKTPASQIVQDFTDLGIKPNLPAVSQGRAVGGLSHGLKEVPLVGDRLVDRLGQTYDETADAAQRIAKGYGSALEPRAMGQNVQAGIKDFADDIFPTRGGELQEKFFKHFKPDDMVDMSQSLRAIRQQGGWDSPEVGALFTDKTLAKWADTIDQGGGKLTVGDAKKFRGEIGKLLKSGSRELGPETPAYSQLLKLYGATSDDLRVAANRVGGAQAVKDLHNADRYWSAGLKRIKNLTDITGGTPESVFPDLIKMASTKGSMADFAKLAQVRNSIAPTDWNDFVSTFIAKMGEPTAGDVNVLARKFSPARLVTAWSSLSDEAKSIMFNGTGKAEWAKEMDKLVRVAGALKNVERLGNPSGTARTLTNLGGLAWFFNEPASATGTAIGALVTEELMMSPKFVRWLYSVPKAGSARAAVADLNRLQLGPAAARLALYLEEQEMNKGRSPAYQQK